MLFQIKSWSLDAWTLSGHEVFDTSGEDYLLCVQFDRTYSDPRDMNFNWDIGICCSSQLGDLRKDWDGLLSI